jgi:uncharacterized membrane protein
MKLLQSQFKVFLSGFLALLPLIVTVALLAWVGGILHRFIGPNSTVGSLLSSIGLAFVTNELVAYAMGVLVFLAAAYALGAVIQTRFRRHLRTLVDNTLCRVPLIGPVYDLTSRFVGMLDGDSQADLKAMSPVWCFFGGQGGVAALALMPNPEPVVLDGRSYLAILVPTAPVPFGGGLIYVPADWVKPAGFGVDRLMSVYVSMGVAKPDQDGASIAGRSG